jgi:preprotein translocase subunit SecD
MSRAAARTGVALFLTCVLVSGCGSAQDPDGSDAKVPVDATVVLTPVEAAGPGALEEAAERLRERAAASGDGPLAVESRDGRIVVTGETGTEQRIRDLVRVGEVTFRAVLYAKAGTDITSQEPTQDEQGATGDGELAVQEDAEVAPELMAEFAHLECDGSGTAAERSRDASAAEPVLGCDVNAFFKYLLAGAEMDGMDIASAEAVFDDQQNTGWTVSMKFTTEGADRFAAVTEELALQPPPRNQFAIVLDGAVVSAPRVTRRLDSGKAVVTGNFSQDEAEGLAAVLASEPLPLLLDITVEPSPN